MTREASAAILAGIVLGLAIVGLAYRLADDQINVTCEPVITALHNCSSNDGGSP